MKKLMSYAADKGSCVVNGICIDNGVGDGEFDVFFVDDVKEANRPVKIIDGIWFDLRFKDIRIWTYDCNRGGDYKTFTENDLDCKAVLFGVDEFGCVFLIKYF